MPFINTIRNWFAKPQKKPQDKPIANTPTEHFCVLSEAITPTMSLTGKPNLWKIRELQWLRKEVPNGITAADYDHEIERALARWAAIKPPGFTFKRTANDAHANILFRAADPPLFGFDYGGTIMENALQPYEPNFVNQLVIALRKSANWWNGTGINVGKVNLPGALTHGVGHTLGMPHDEKPGNLMHKQLSHISEPTARDIQRFQELYAVEPVPVPPVIPTPTPTPTPAQSVLSRVVDGSRIYEGWIPLIN